MMTTERFTVDDAGTLIDMSTRNTYDYVSDVCGLLNELSDENEQLRHDASVLIQSNQDYRKENEQLKQEKESLIKGIKDTAKQGADTITAVWESKNRPTTINKGYYDR